MIRWSALALGFTFAVACSSGSSSGGGTGGSGAGTGGTGGGGTPSTTPLAYKPCSEAARLGGITVALISNGDSTPFTAVTRGVRNKVDPGELWDELAKEGGCRLMAGKMAVCHTACTGEQTCDPNMKTCIDQPKLQDTGTLTVTGLSEAVSLTWSAMSGYYKSLTSYPPAGAEIAIGAKTSGATVPAFSL